MREQDGAAFLHGVSGVVTSILDTATNISQIPSNVPNKYLTPQGAQTLANQAFLSPDNIDLSFAEELSTEEFKNQYGVDADNPALELS